MTTEQQAIQLLESFVDTCAVYRENWIKDFTGTPQFETSFQCRYCHAWGKIPPRIQHKESCLILSAQNFLRKIQPK